MKFNFIEEFRHEFNSLKNFYPKFIYSNKYDLDFNQIPIFVFHTIVPEIFEEQLKYLSQNFYNTLSINDYLKMIKGEIEYIPNSILLTCDDGRFSFWQYAYPLLKKYNLKTTLFVIPGITEETDIYRKNLEDVWNEEETIENLVNENKNDSLYCNWQELRTMYDSNLIDIESHTLMHKIVFTDKKIIGFINKTTHDSVLTAYRNEKKIESLFNKEDYYGLPIYNHEPLLKGNQNFRVDERVIQESSKDDLMSNKEKLQKFSEDFNTLKTSDEVESEILYDLSKSREIIKEKINKNAGEHLCLPWTIGTEETIELSKQAGYKSVYWGIREDKRINSVNDDPFYNSRIKNDFIFRLPGKERKSLVKTYKEKILRRLTGSSGY